MQTHSAARLPSPRRSKIEVDPVKLGRELAGLTGRANLTDEEYARTRIRVGRDDIRKNRNIATE